MYLLAFPKVIFIDTVEQLLTNLGGYRFDFLNQRARRGAEGYQLGAPVIRGCLAMNQALRLQTIEQPGQGRSFDRNALSQLPLGRIVIEPGQVQQNEPARLRQAKVRKPAIEFSTPATRQLCQLHGEAMLIGVHEDCSWKT